MRTIVTAACLAVMASSAFAQEPTTLQNLPE